MSHEQFEILMPVIAADIIRMLMVQEGISEDGAIRMLYTSELFAALEQEATKLWHYSTPMLCALLKQEIQTGKIQYPDV